MIYVGIDIAFIQLMNLGRFRQKNCEAAYKTRSPDNFLCGSGFLFLDSQNTSKYSRELFLTIHSCSLRKFVIRVIVNLLAVRFKP